jgi:hypothetical protein
MTAAAWLKKVYNYKEPINSHDDALIFIRQKIGGCFGDQDNIFAGHPCDEDRAKTLRELAFENNVTLEEVQDIALGYLFRKTPDMLKEYQKEQIEEITKFFREKIC